MVAKANCLSNHQIYVARYTACYVGQVQNVTFLFLPLRFVRKEKLTDTCCIDFTIHMYITKKTVDVTLCTQKQCLFTVFLLCSYLCTLVLAYNPLFTQNPLSSMCVNIAAPYQQADLATIGQCFNTNATKKEGSEDTTTIHTYNGVNTAQALHWTTSHSSTIPSTGFSYVSKQKPCPRCYCPILPTLES